MLSRKEKGENEVKVLLLNIDSKLPNIALHKIAMWHKQQGNEVLWGSPMEIYGTDKVYASCIFTKNMQKISNLVGLRPDILAGGTGYDLTIKLPPEVEAMKPKINYGFTTRGCIRKCPFCIVPKAEGYIRVVGDIYDIWDGKSKSITLLDNNILAMPLHFKKICQQVSDVKIAVDFNQALDIRLVDNDIASILSRTKYKGQISFSFDYMNIKQEFNRGMEFLQKAEIRMSKIMIFLLVGFNTTLFEDLERIETVKSYGASPFVMKYQEVNGIKPIVKRNGGELRELARWVNQPHGFYKVMSFGEWIQIKGNEVKSDIEL